MQSYRLTWTENGEKKVSAVRYSESVVETYRALTQEQTGADDVEAMPVGPME